MNRNLKQQLLVYVSNCRISAYLMQNTAKKIVDEPQQKIVKQHSALHYQAAFSLTELMVTVALLAVLATIAVPSTDQVQRYYERVKVERITQQMLQEGRNTGFLLRQRIIICGSRYGTQCSSAEWQQGMLMFHDVNLDNVYSPELDTVLRFEPLNLKYGTWQWIGGAKFKSFVRFEHTSGMPHASFGSFHYCDFEQQHPFKLVMRNTGVSRKDNKDVSC